MRNKYLIRITLTLLMLVILSSLFSCDWLFSNWFDRDTKAVIKNTNENNETNSYVSKTVFVNGGDSICGASETLTYEWTFEIPSGSATILEEVIENGRIIDSKRKFTPDVPGSYKVTLYVEDDDSDSHSITKDIIVKDKPQYAPANLNVKSVQVESLKIGWDTVTDATQYLLFKDTSTFGPFGNKVYEGPALEYIDTGLAAGTTYYYKVQAKNPAGTSNLSGYIEASTKLGVPPNFQATGNTTTSVNLNWGSSQNATSYVVEKKLTESGTYVDAYNGNATSCTLNNLDAGAVYYFRIKSLNSISNSDYSTQIRVNLSVSPPSVPESGVITSGTQNSLTYSWSNVNGATSYNVYRSSTENGIYTKVGNSIVNIPFTDSGLQPGTRYYYKVTSVVSVMDEGTPINLESGKSNSSNGITIPPNPTNLSITNRTSTAISINCPVVTGADSYKIFKREGSSGSFEEVRAEDIQISGTTFTANGLSPSTQYAFRMTANNVTGVSGYSSEISASTTALPVFLITASAGSGGSISPSSVVSVSQNGSQSFTISANTGFNIQSVYVDGVNQGAISNYTFNNVTSNHTITASFTIKSYTITASAGSGGIISPSGNVTVTHNGSKYFSISANSGYHIQSVYVDGVNQGAISSYTFNSVTSDHTITASFTQDLPSYYTITASAGSGGSISPSGNVQVPRGANQTFTISANTGYNIQNVYVDGVNQGAISSYTFYNVNSTHTITASFVIKTYTITASAGSGGSISPSGNVIVPHNGSKDFSISPNSGYRIQSVYVDGVNQGAISNYTFYNVTSNHTITASFSSVQADLWVKNLSITLPDGNPRGKHPTYVYYETYNYGPTNVADAWYRTDYYLSTDSTINSSDILIGSYESQFDVGVGQTEIHNLTSTWRNRITIPETLPSRSYYFGVHVVPVSGSPSEPDDSDNWNRGNSVVIPMEVVIINNSSRSMYYFYMRPYNSSTWGSDLLGSSTVPSGSSFTVYKERGSTDKWDLKAQDSSGTSWIAEDQNIGDCYKLTYTLTNTTWTTTWYR